MKFLIKSTCAVILLSVLMGCGSRDRVNESARLQNPPALPSPSLEPVNARAIVDGIPANASREQIDTVVQRYLSDFSKARLGDWGQFRSALAAVRNQPHLVASFVDHYDRLPKQDHLQRMSTLGILGELRRPEAMPFLKKAVWTPLPPRAGSGKSLSARDLEEMVMFKAIHGLGYLRTPDSDKVLIEVMQQHESHALRNVAIDTYMWNHSDSADAAQRLYQLLPANLHKFVQRPRFRRGMDKKHFNEQLEAWQRKWGTAPN